MEQSLILKLFEAYAEITTIPWVGLPLLIFGWSFIKSTSYYQDNSAFHTKLHDILDRKAFQKIIVPLFSFISKSLTEEIVDDTDLQQITDKDDLLKAADNKKEAILKQRDFSSLESAVEFQDVIEKMLKSKKNQMSLKRLIKNCRQALIGLTITSGLTLVLGVFLIYSHKVMNNNTVSLSLAIAWGICFAIVFVLGAIYYYKTIKIEGLSNEEN